MIEGIAMNIHQNYMSGQRMSTSEALLTLTLALTQTSHKSTKLNLALTLLSTNPNPNPQGSAMRTPCMAPSDSAAFLFVFESQAQQNRCPIEFIKYRYAAMMACRYGESLMARRSAPCASAAASAELATSISVSNRNTAARPPIIRTSKPHKAMRNPYQLQGKHSRVVAWLFGLGAMPFPGNWQCGMRCPQCHLEHKTRRMHMPLVLEFEERRHLAFAGIEGSSAIGITRLRPCGHTCRRLV